MQSGGTAHVIPCCHCSFPGNGGGKTMKVETGIMVPLGYGKFFRSEKIVGLEPVEEGRGPGHRTKVYVEALSAPVIASRSEGAILGDLIKQPKEVTKTREQYLLLSDILDTITDIDPLLRSIVRDQGKWDLDKLEEQIREVLSDEEEAEPAPQLSFLAERRHP